MDSIGDGGGGDSATPREEHSIGNGNGNGGDSATPREEHSMGGGDGGNSATPRDAPPLLISQQSISAGSYSPRPVDESALKISTASTFENGVCKVCKRMHFQNFMSFINCLNAGDCCSRKCTCQGSLPKAESEAIILRFRQQEEKRLRRASKNEDSKGCKCVLSKCVKLYCVCFNNGEYCAEGCDCRDCYNKTDNEDMIRDIRQQIRNLELDYIDLYLIHWPLSLKPGEIKFPFNKEDLLPMDFKAVWEAMEESQKLGLV